MSMENQPTPQAVQQPQVQQSGDDEVNLMDLLLVIAKHNRFIMKFAGGVAVLSIIVLLLMPNVYTAKVMIMPPQQTQSSAASMLMGQIGAIGGLTGVDKSPSAIYTAMLKSRSVADALIDRFKLMELYDAKTYVAVRKILEGDVAITAGKEGMITVEFDHKDAKLAAAIANGYVEELDNLVRTLAAKEALGRKLFFEKQLGEVHESLDRAELEMKGFQEQNRVFRLGGEGGMVLGASGGIPKAELEYVRIARNVKYNEMLLGAMVQQVATAKMDEAKDAAVIQVVDKALPPEKKSKPKRALIVLLATILAFFFGIFWAFFKEASERARQNPEQAERISLLHRYFRQGK